MTAQAPERILINGDTQGLSEWPLKTYIGLGGQLPELNDFWTSAHRRGYVGTWQIIDERLYLIKIRASLKNGEFGNLGDLFPGYPDRVFAHWYCGTLTIPEGKEIEHENSEFEAKYERDRLIYFENGVVTKTIIRHNGEAPEGAHDPFQVAAWWQP